jgi:catechol 2,3-dioxygenase-like lactoylglutathione lyase family enzyme
MQRASRDVLIQTQDMERATAFYRDVLGLEVFLNEANLVGLEAGAFRLFLDRGPAYGPVFEVYVADLEAAKTALVEAGCVIEQEDPTVPRCYLRDPFGLVFNIAEHRADQD